MKHYVATPAPGGVCVEWKASPRFAEEVASYLNRNCDIPAIAIAAETEDAAIAQATAHYYGQAVPQ